MLNNGVRISVLWIVLLTEFFLGCGTGNNSTDPKGASNTGNIYFNLCSDSHSPMAIDPAAVRNAEKPDICVDYLIDAIEVEIHRSSDDSLVVSQTWDCLSHHGIIHNVPSGLELYLICKGSVVGKIQWQGQSEDFTVTAGQTNDIGTILLAYTGDDRNPPQVVAVFPPEGGNGFDLQTSIAAKFNEPLAVSSISDQAVNVTHDSISVSGRIIHESGSDTIIFIPADPMQPESNYNVSLSPGIVDTAGLRFDQAYAWQFTTGSSTDTRDPEVIYVTPAQNAIDVDLDTVIKIHFSEPMDEGSLGQMNLTVSSSQEPIFGQIFYDSQSRMLSLTPAAPLSPSTQYRVVLDTGSRDQAGNSMSAPYSWSFSTLTPRFNLNLTKAGDGSGTVVSSPAGIDCGGTCVNAFFEDTHVTLIATPDSSSQFQGWSGGGCIDSEPCTVQMNGDVTVTASFSLVTHTITASATIGGTITPSGSISIGHHAQQDFQINANPGYYLSGLIVDGTQIAPAESYSFEDLVANHTIHAVFQAVRFVDAASSSWGDGLA